jgi:benzodiazapine receptor
MAGLATSLLFPVLSGSAVGYLTRGKNQSDYQATKLPRWAPPARLFGIVWPLLYLLMGGASWLVWRSEAEPGEKSVALSLYVAQLAFNLSWSFVYFYLADREAALAVLVVIDLLVAVMCVYFYSINHLAGLLLAPYAAWLLYATALNFAIVRSE